MTEFVTEVLGGSGPRARSTDPITSSLAADSSEGSVWTSHQLVLGVLEAAEGTPLTEEQIVTRAKSYPWSSPLTGQRIRSAVKELAGGSYRAPQFEGRPLVVVAEEFGVTVTGRKAQTWRLADE